MNRLAYYAVILVIFGLTACGGGSKKSDPVASSSSIFSSSISSSPASSEAALSSSSIAFSSSSFTSSSSSDILSSSSIPSSSADSSSSLNIEPSSSSISSAIAPLGSSSASSIAQLFVTASGVVVDEIGVPVAEASIAVEGTNIVAATDDEGGFSIDLSTQTPAVLRISKSGFASTIRAAARASDNRIFADRVVLHSVGATINLDAADENILRVPGSTARVDLPANSLARADGSVFSGAAQVTLTPIDPSVNVEFMPGVMVDSDSGVAIESMGAMGVEFTDSNGQPLNLGANKTAIIRIPATPKTGVTPPATMPLYHLNEVTGLWEQDGVASLQTDPVSGEQYYQGEVSHFSWWNADQVIDRATIDYSQTESGSCDYNSLPDNVELVVQGVSYSGWQTLSPKGNTPLYAKALANARVMLRDANGILDVVDITLPAAGGIVKISRCLIKPPQVTVSGKVTVSSGDLDAYRVQIAGARSVTKTVDINDDGSYSVNVYANSGVISARLVGGIAQRDTPASSATVTVANANIAFADLIITDDKVIVSGCIDGWENYPHQRAQLNIFKDGDLIQNLFDVTSQNRTFSFVANINQLVSLVITPAGDNLREKTIPIDVATANITLGNCLQLPKAPTAAAVVSGSGFSRTFDASTSTEGDANIVKYEWTFSDGATAEGQYVNHTFAAFGSYFVTLKVTDALKQQASTNSIPVTITDNTQTVTIKPALLSSGILHTCMVTAEGGLKCWGNNDSGQLGNGTFYNGVRMEDAVAINGLNDVVAVSAGGNHSCAITASGALKCWGDNASGQLGNGVGEYGLNSNLPVDVVGLGSGVVAVSLGRSHSCAITTLGAVKCWGSNGSGQLGNGTNTNSNIPVDVVGLSGAQLISAGNGHTCAAITGAGVLCWGDNDEGALGNSTTIASNLPVAVSGLTEPVISLATGYAHSCAVTDAGLVKCWGYNIQGQLGIGSTNDSSVPVQITSLSDIVKISLGDQFSCTLNNSGYTSCWGNNSYGQLGNDVIWFIDEPTSANVQEGSADTISTGGYTTCALKADGNVQCWGWSELYMPGG